MGKVSLTQILECSSGGYLGTQSWSVMNGILSKSSKIVHFSQICYTFMSCSVIHYQIGVPPNPKTLVQLRLMIKMKLLWKCWKWYGIHGSTTWRESVEKFGWNEQFLKIWTKCHSIPVRTAYLHTPKNFYAVIYQEEHSRILVNETFFIR